MVGRSDVNLGELFQPHPPASLANMSSMRGRGYSSIRSRGFTVILKSPQIRTAPFGLTTGTIGVDQSLNLTLRLS